MKKSILILAVLFCSLFVTAQPTEIFNYQAVVRDAEGNLVANKDISFQIEILAGTPDGTVVFRETHAVTTNANGLVTLPVVGGTHDGMWVSIVWGTNDYFLKVYLDLENGTNFTEMGTSPILSVPIAAYAGTAGKLEGYLSSFNEVDVSDCFRVGDAALPISDITTIAGTADNISNSIDIALPDGFTQANTIVLSVEIRYNTGGVMPSDYSYGLGYTATNGTVSYRLAKYGLVAIGDPANVVTVYYPDELKGKNIHVLLLRTCNIL